jgi:flagellar biosynthesis/type III secretory pathway chaperone
MSNASRIADLVQITNRLSDLLERESALLRARKLTEMESVRQEKFTLSSAYETNVRALRSQPEMLAEATPETRQQIKAAFDRFEKALALNERSLRAAKEVSDRVLRAIADEVGRKRSENLAYSPNGHASAQPTANVSAPVSVAVDERF